MQKLLRMDKFLCEEGLGTRSEVKALLKKGLVTVNGTVCKSPDQKVNPDVDEVIYQGVRLHYQKFFYYMLHKPQGVITATEDKAEHTVMELLGKDLRKDLFPVGRLDKDTEGLLLITNDGELGHRLLSPRHHIPKTYFVRIEHGLLADEIARLEEGLDIGEKNLTLPAKIEVIDECSVYITITEGKFHQIKRMFEAVDNKVLYLKRVSMGELKLDVDLALGQYRRLTEEEIAYLKSL